MQVRKPTSRREFLKLAALGTAGTAILAACSQPAASPTAAPAKPAEAPKAAEPTKPAAAAAPTQAAAAAKPAEPTKPAAAAQPAPKAGAGQSVITFTTQGNKTELEMFDKILDDFEKSQSKIKVDRKYDTTLTWPKVINMYRAGTASDVLRTNDDDIFILLAADVVMSMDDYIKRDFKKDDYYAMAFTTRVGAGGEVGSTLVGTAPTVMFYNVDLFEKAGVKPPTDFEKDNWTIDQLEEAMSKLVKKSGGRTDVYAWSEPYWWAETALWNEGVPLYNADQTKAQLATPEALAFMTRYQKWYNDGWAAPFTENMAQLFNSGVLAMTYQDMNFATTLKNTVKWDCGPTAKGKKFDTVFHNDRNFGTPKASKVRDESWELHKWLMTMTNDGKGGMAEFARNDWGVPTLKKAAEGEIFNDPKKLPKNHKIYAQGAARGWPIPDNPMAEEFQVIFRRIDALQTGKQTPEQFLKEGEASVNRVIEQTGWNKSKDVRGFRLPGVLDKFEGKT